MRPKKILIVDDDSINIEMLKNIFDNEEFHVLQASGGFEAVRIAKIDHPDLIILDIVMPDIDGGEVANILKNDPATQNIPIIFLSSLIRKEEEQSGSSQSGVYLMAKPFDRNTLLNKVKAHI